MTDKVQIRLDDRFLRLPQVKGLTGRSKTQIYGDSTFPRPIKLGRRESAWIESEVRAWMQEKVDSDRARRRGEEA
jgi:prophage regulatory protein